MRDNIISYMNTISDKERVKYENAINEIGKKISKTSKRVKSVRNKTQPLHRYFDISNDYEMGIDEAGRGPLFGRVYVAGVILPKDDDDFKYHIIKDSKRYSSKKKLKEVYEYIIENCIDYFVSYKDEEYIDKNNIRQSVLDGMNDCIMNINTKPNMILIDGCDFINKTGDNSLIYKCIEGGDNWYTSIAAASVIAKYERDLYIEQICEIHPDINEKYDILSNKGYGTKKHMNGIREFGITQFHRTSYGICKYYKKN